VPWKAYQLYLHRGKAALAAMYLRRFRVVGRATYACGTKPQCGAWNGIRAVAKDIATLAHRARQHIFTSTTEGFVFRFTDDATIKTATWV
jgi:hypothetical protein